MNVHFYKYQGTGNDFVMIDNRKNNISLSTEQIAFLCKRHFGVGADGLILLQKEDEEFVMKYYNSDGNQSTMCGNGGRCFVKFLYDLRLIQNNVKFKAIDGYHTGEIVHGNVRLKMVNVTEVKVEPNYLFLNTGSPHHVEFVEDLDGLNVKERGSEIRFSERYSPNGTNVNFVQKGATAPIKMRTYERGVEDETLSCGTGVTAVALALFEQGILTEPKATIETKGGTLTVDFTPKNNSFDNIYLTGPAKKVFEGTIHL